MAKAITLEAGDFGIETAKLAKLVGMTIYAIKSSGQELEGRLEVKDPEGGTFQVKTGKRGKPPVFLASELETVVAA